MNNNEMTLAALAAALDVAGDEWKVAAACRMAEQEAELVELRGRNVTLEQIKASQNTYIAQYREALDLALEERDAAETELEHAKNASTRLLDERGGLKQRLENADSAFQMMRQERNEAQAELRKHYSERGPTCVKWLAEGGMREVLDILSQPHPVNVSEAAAEHLERGLGTNMIWARRVVAQINAWWQDRRELEDALEFGL